MTQTEMNRSTLYKLKQSDNYFDFRQTHGSTIEKRQAGDRQAAMGQTLSQTGDRWTWDENMKCIRVKLFKKGTFCFFLVRSGVSVVSMVSLECSEKKHAS